jgi:UPF0755 protein
LSSNESKLCKISQANRTTDRMKKTLVIVFILLAGVLAIAAYAGHQYKQFLLKPLSISEQGMVLNVDRGMSGKAIITRLSELGMSEDLWQWRLLMRLEPVIFKTGEYQLQQGLKPRELLRQLEQGEVIRYRFTIVEGWSYRQLLDALKDDPVLGEKLQDGNRDASWQAVETAWDHPEGAFLPETYVFTRDDSARDVLERASKAMLFALGEAWEARIDHHPLKSEYELLILASNIEKETALDGERDQIAGVFVRRLNKRMRLQTDPTVIYGLGEAYDGDIRRKDLQTDTPYNTYTRHGLPPTPIAMPGRASLFAAAQPADGDSLYFVADGQGGHTFSATLEQHQRAVNKLLGRK